MLRKFLGLFTKGYSPIVKAILDNNRLAVERLVHKGLDVNAPTENGDTPLFVAVRAGSHEIAISLLIYGADPNQRDKRNHLPLTVATACGDLLMVELLLVNGADVNATDMNFTALRIAKDKGYAAIEKLLLDFRKETFISYRSNDAPYVRLFVEQLISRGIPIWFDEYNITTETKELILGSDNGFREIIREAVKGCSNALCFTNPSYAESEYCIEEASFITDRIPASKIIEVRCPEHQQLYQKVPGFGVEASTSIHQNSELKNASQEEIELIWDKLAAALDVKLNKRKLILDRTPIKLETMEWLDSLHYTMDFGGWKKIEGRRVENNSGLDVRGGKFTRQIDGLEITATVDVGLQAILHRAQFPSIEDRPAFILAVCKMMDQYAKEYPHSIFIDLETRGSHFIEVEGLGHAFFTLYDLANEIWWRQYSVVLPNPAMGQTTIDACLKKEDPTIGSEIEFCVQFGIPKATFEQYCSLGYLMDRVVTSLRCPKLMR